MNSRTKSAKLKPRAVIARSGRPGNPNTAPLTKKATLELEETLKAYLSPENKTKEEKTMFAFNSL
jgi:hypothetical protein